MNQLSVLTTSAGPLIGENSARQEMSLVREDGWQPPFMGQPDGTLYFHPSHPLSIHYISLLSQGGVFGEMILEALSKTNICQK